MQKLILRSDDDRLLPEWAERLLRDLVIFEAGALAGYVWMAKAYGLF
ncbi:hypothetical protein [Desulfonema ishimotonii]|nr:hypothetical protein [Desulfonema ishimotonii]